MKSFVLGAGLLLALAIPSTVFAASDAPLAPVHQFVAALDKGDAKGAQASFAASQSLTDEFTPFNWQGSDAFTGWFKDFGAWAQKGGVSEPSLKLVKRMNYLVEGDKAYYVASATFSFKQGGKQVVETGLVTFGLSNEADGWRITSFTWSRQG